MVPTNQDLLPTSIRVETTIFRDALVAELEPIVGDPNIAPYNREMLAELIESPLLLPCQCLWDKGIRTIASSSNKKDVSIGHAYLVVDWDTLSEENRAIALDIATKVVTPEDGDIFILGQIVNETVVWVDPQPSFSGRGHITIAIPMDEQTTVSTVESAALEIVSIFKKQPALWVDEYSLAEVAKLCGVDVDTPFNPEYFIEIGFYYDDEKDRFFLSEESFKLKYGQ